MCALSTTFEISDANNEAVWSAKSFIEISLERLKLDNSVDIMLNLSFLSSAFQINKKLLKDKLIRINKNILQN